MKVKYTTTIKVTALYDIDTLENLKDNNEYADGLTEMICDEIATAGGVGVCEIIDSSIDVNRK